MTVVTESTKEMEIAKVRWTSADIDLFPNDDTRYEIIDGELLVTRAPIGIIRQLLIMCVLP